MNRKMDEAIALLLINPTQYGGYSISSSASASTSTMNATNSLPSAFEGCLCPVTLAYMQLE